MLAKRLLATVAALAIPLAGLAQGYPDKPIRLIVPFAPGGVTDTSGRVIAEGLGRRLGQQVVVENKAGASGNIGTASVAAAPADGYTLVLAFDGTMVINPHVFAKIPFDTLKDFAPVGKIGDATLIIVSHPSFPGKTLKELIDISKKDPKGVSYGTSGIGGTPHIAGELLNLRAGAKLVHVPYKGGGQAMSDALGGNVPLVYTAVAGAIKHVEAGKLHAIAVSSRTRSPSLPNTPTFIEAGVPDFEASSWVGILAPAGTPRPVIDRLNKELNALLTSPEVVERLAKLGIVATPGTPEQFGEQMKADLAKYGPVVKAAGIKAD
ncbi:MAG TPA: tripartite tricarboxylate transporter substrate binding protein [Usitatibacteraceae bacterium]|nr:tripartite tricarboxylate transporter substrate binding protein [Usitatibacteraceae bacterium]HRA22942.1 tripartite tricarboxylate transporter substrate binding protein [Usitatibacteraceae bacterium]